MVVAPSPFGHSKERPGWAEAFATVIDRLRQEGSRRNGIVHSQYLFEFVEAGMAPLRSDRRKKDGVPQFEREFLDPDRRRSSVNSPPSRSICRKPVSNLFIGTPRRGRSEKRRDFLRATRLRSVGCMDAVLRCKI